MDFAAYARLADRVVALSKGFQYRKTPPKDPTGWEAPTASRKTWRKGSSDRAERGRRAPAGKVKGMLRDAAKLDAIAERAKHLYETRVTVAGGQHTVFEGVARHARGAAERLRQIANGSELVESDEAARWAEWAQDALGVAERVAEHQNEEHLLRQAGQSAAAWAHRAAAHSGSSYVHEGPSIRKTSRHLQTSRRAEFDVLSAKAHAASRMGA